MSMVIEVLVLDDEAIVCERLKEYLEKKNCRVETFTESQEAIDCLGERSFDVVVTDLKMKGPTGLDILHFVRDNCKGTQVIIITGFPTMEAVREAQYGSVFDFINKPFQMEKIESMVKKAAKKARKLKGRTDT
jgi:DNA-binding NtrC family response regulator